MYAILTTDSSGGVVLKTPYDPAFLEQLKEAIPYSFREWDRENKVWRIHTDYGDALKSILEAYGAVVTDRRIVARGDASIPHKLREAFAALHVTPEAPLFVAEASYKALARKFHPDVGGDATSMRLLNDAIEAIREQQEVR